MALILTNEFELLTSAFKNKTVLITGSSGFFGKNLIEIFKFANQKYSWQVQLITVSRGKGSEVDEGLSHISWDLCQQAPAHLPEKIDCIIHCASPLNSSHLDSAELEKSIHTAMVNILDYAKRANIEKFLFTSSGAVYGAQPAGTSHIDESHKGQLSQGDSKSVYGRSKLSAEKLGEAYAKKHNFSFVSARCFALSGRYLPLDKNFAIGNFVKNLINDEPIQVNGDPRTLRSYMDSEDLCYWLLKLLVSGSSGEAYNVGSEEAISIGELAYLVDSFREKSNVVLAHKEDTQKLASPAYVPSTKKARDSFQLKLNVPLRSSIQKMIDFAGSN